MKQWSDSGTCPSCSEAIRDKFNYCPMCGYQRTERTPLWWEMAPEGVFMADWCAEHMKQQILYRLNTIRDRYGDDDGLRSPWQGLRLRCRGPGAIDLLLSG